MADSELEEKMAALGQAIFDVKDLNRRLHEMVYGAPLVGKTKDGLTYRIHRKVLGEVKQR